MEIHSVDEKQPGSNLDSRDVSPDAPQYDIITILVTIHNFFSTANYVPKGNYVNNLFYAAELFLLQL